MGNPSPWGRSRGDTDLGVAIPQRGTPIAFFVILLSLLLGGCGGGDRPSPTATDQSSPNQRADGIVPTPLRLTITDVPDQTDLEAEYGPFRDVLAAAIKTPVTLVAVEQFAAATPALVNGQVDLALAGPAEYVLLRARAQVIPTLAISRPDFQTVISVRPDSPIRAIAQLKGKAIAITEEGTTASHLGAAVLLRDHGLDALKDVRLIPLFGRQVQALAGGEVDAWADSSQNRRRRLREANLPEDAFPIIGRGEALPNDVFVARSGLSLQWLATLKDTMLAHETALMEAIVSIPANRKYTGSRLVPVNDGDYDLVRKGYRLVGQESLLR
jgi:phosphonate transport system substrate-binding protein